MAVRFDVAGDQLVRSTNLPSIASFTMMAWVKISSDTNAFAAFLNFNAGSGLYYYIGTAADGTTLALYAGGAVISGSALTVGSWYHIAMTVSGTGVGQFLGYLDGVLNITADGNAALTANSLWIGKSDDGNQLNGVVAAVKVYNAVLTPEEIAQEMWTIRPQRYANLVAWAPCWDAPDAASDYGGGGNWTPGGTLTSEDGPPVSYGAPSTWPPFFVLLSTPLSPVQVYPFAMTQRA